MFEHSQELVNATQVSQEEINQESQEALPENSKEPQESQEDQESQEEINQEINQESQDALPENHQEPQESQEDRENESQGSNQVRRGRKRTRQPLTWKKNIAKRRRNTGQSYTYTSRNGARKERSAKKVGAGCGNGCRFRCKTKMSQQCRIGIHQSFWGYGNIERQREFINRHVTVKAVKRRRSRNTIKKTSSREYNLTINNSQIRVCQTMFLHTLAISSTFVNVALSKNDQHGTLRGDQRGNRRRPSQHFDDIKRKMRQHISSFPTVDGHYVRKTSKRKYLDAKLNVRAMFRLYKEWCVDENMHGKESMYRNIFNTEYNIGFQKPKKDLCNYCEEYNSADANKKEQMQATYDEHMMNKNLVREQKKRDSTTSKNTNNFTAAVFDLQQVLPCPSIDASCAYYLRKLAVYNLTIYELGTKKGHNFMWHEGIAARGANEISSAVYDFLYDASISGTQEIALYSDCCGGQNRNRFMFSMYLYVIATTNIQKITHRFLESGHSVNEGDMMHALIEKRKRKQSVYTPQQYYDLVEKAKVAEPHFTVKQMAQADIVDFKEFALNKDHKFQWQYDTNHDKVQWSKIKVIEVDANYPNNLSIKYTHVNDGNEICVKVRNEPRRRTRALPARKAMIPINELPIMQAYNQPMSITQNKKKDLVKMLNVIPAEYHEFYHNLEVEVPLQSDGSDESEESDSDSGTSTP